MQREDRVREHRQPRIAGTPRPAARAGARREERGRSGWVLAVVCVATAMLMLDIAVVNTALPHIALDLHAGLTGVAWVVDAYTLALAATVLTTGAVADRLGRRRLFSTGLALFSLASLACAVAQSMITLDAFRAVQGLAAAVLFSSSLAVLADAFPTAGERARALAAYGATIGASFAVGPLVGGALTSYLGWRWIFLVNLPLGVACLAVTRLHVRESRNPQARGLDWWGQSLLTGGLFLLVLGLLRGNEDGWSSRTIVAELAAAVVLLAGFVVAEARVRTPMLPLGLFRNWSFTGAQVAAFAISASFFAVFFYVTLYLQEVLGLSPIEAGLVYLPGTVVMFLVSGASAGLARHISERAMISGGLVLVTAGLALVTLGGATSSWSALLPGLLVVSVGGGIFNPALGAVALGSVPAEQAGLAAGVNDAFRQAGIAVGVAALGALLPVHAALERGSVAYVSGLHHALLVSAGVAAAGAVASAVLIRGRARPAGAVDEPVAVTVTEAA